ncbi:MAG TPA: single-stranded DNA-binding protein [Acidothermaceae bacterium]|jgi:single-strand DNA-binding protein|nr:single-stranded DNA-binding protein [Acidothermaceae bacterium]
MFDTQVTVVGNLVAEPRLAFTKDGQAVASFRLASTPRRFDRTAGEWKDGDTLYTSVTCWRALAENVSASLKKGASVIVLGRLSVRPYETRDGAQRQSVDIDAIAIGPDLGRAIALVKRAERGVPAPVETALADPVPPTGGAGDDAVDTDAPPAGVTDWGWSSGAAPVAPADPLDDEVEDPDDDEVADALEPAETVEAAPPAQLTGVGGRWRSRSAG